MLNLRKAERYIANLKSSGGCTKQQLARIFSEFKAHYPELKDAKKLHASRRFDRGHKLIEEAFYCTFRMYLQLYAELGLKHLYCKTGDTTEMLLSSDEYIAMIYLDIPRVLIYFKYDAGKIGLKSYLKSRVRSLVQARAKEMRPAVDMDLAPHIATECEIIDNFNDDTDIEQNNIHAGI